MEHKLEFMALPGSYALAAQFNRMVARRIADELDRGKALEVHDQEFVAMILREWADNLKDEPQRKPGQAPKFCHATAAVVWAMKVGDGMNKSRAKDQVAEELGVTVEAIGKAIKKNGAAATEFVATLKMFNPQT